MSANPDEKTTIDEEVKPLHNPEELNKLSELDIQDNEIRSRLRKNPKKTVLLYSAENLNKLEKKKKVIQTDLKEEDLKLFKTIIEKLKAQPESYYFRTSPFKQFETKEDKQIYKSIISHPMDLLHITKKINNLKYATYQDFYNDIVLIWDNAQTFNLKDSVFYADAEYMRNYTEKIFKEKKIDDKVKHKEKKEIPNEDENNEEEKKEENNYELDNEENNSEKDDVNKDKNYIGKKRKKNENNESDYNEEKDKMEEELGNPIIDIKNSDNENMGIKNKKNNKNSNSNQFKKSPSSRSSLPNNEKKLENILQNTNDKNNNNKSPEDKMENNKENNTNNNDENKNSENNNNNNNVYTEEYKSDEIKKINEKFKMNEDLIKSYSYKIARKLDKLTDEDMFDLIEFIETIKPEAIIDNENLVNIDMTKFEGETFINVYNFVENAILKNSIYK